MVSYDIMKYKLWLCSIAVTSKSKCSQTSLKRPRTWTANCLTSWAAYCDPIFWFGWPFKSGFTKLQSKSQVILFKMFEQHNRLGWTASAQLPSKNNRKKNCKESVCSSIPQVYFQKTNLSRSEEPVPLSHTYRTVLKPTTNTLGKQRPSHESNLTHNIHLSVKRRWVLTSFHFTKPFTKSTCSKRASQKKRESTTKNIPLTFMYYLSFVYLCTRCGYHSICKWQKKMAWIRQNDSIKIQQEWKFYNRENKSHFLTFFVLLLLFLRSWIRFLFGTIVIPCTSKTALK